MLEWGVEPGVNPRLWSVDTPSCSIIAVPKSCRSAHTDLQSIEEGLHAVPVVFRGPDLPPQFTNIWGFHLKSALALYSGEKFDDGL